MRFALAADPERAFDDDRHNGLSERDDRRGAEGALAWLVESSRSGAPQRRREAVERDDEDARLDALDAAGASDADDG